MTDFDWASRKERDGLAKIQRTAEAAPAFAAAGELYEAFHRHCKRAARFARLDPDNMEDIFCVAEAIRASTGSSLILNGVPREPEKVVQQIKLWLWKVCHVLRALYRCELTSPDPRELVNPEPYRTLMKVLKEHRLADRLTVLTTNYDLVFEYFANEIGMPCWYPMTRAKDFWLYDPGGNGQRRHFVRHGTGNHPGPLVCKLHGSVNYWERVGGPQKDRFGISSDILPAGKTLGKKGSGLGNDKDGPAILAVDAILQVQRNHAQAALARRPADAESILADPPLVPAIIPPTYAKLHDTPWLRETWRAAVEALSHARVLVVIGYSMPPSDGFMRSMVHAAMAQRCSSQPLTVHIVDPNAHSSAARCLFCAEGTTVRLHAMGFEEWVKGDLDGLAPDWVRGQL